MSIEINGIAHIQLTVNDPERCIPFWERLCHFLGMSTLMKADGMVYCIGGRYFSATPGEPLSVAAGAHHFLYNGGQSDAHFIWEFRPALDMERLLETKFALAARGRLNAHGRPRFWQAIALANTYHGTERTTTVPWPLQRPLLALLAPLARVERAEEFLAV